MRPVSFRLLTMSDMPMLHEWLGRPHIVEWWGPVESFADIVEYYEPFTVPGAPLQGYIAIAGSREIGYIQSYVVKGSGDGWWIDEQDPGARGIDQFLAHGDQLGQGLGTTLVRGFLVQLFEDPAVTRVQTDPAPENARAIRCYSKAGFRAVGEVHTPDGPALLMTCTRLRWQEVSSPSFSS